MDDIYRQPVVKCVVTLSGDAVGSTKSALSDAKGVFEFGELESGKFQLRLERQGFFPLFFGEISLAASGAVDTGEITLATQRVIAGTVRWKDGEPAAGATVQVVPIKGGAAPLRVGPDFVRPVVTDDRGGFRFFNLRPGRYVLFAYNQILVEAHSKARVALPVFYPRSSILDVHGGVDLRKTRGIEDISLELEERSGVEVEGSVAAGALVPADVMITVGVMIAFNPAQYFAVARLKAGEAFRFAIPPGSYLLVASVPGLGRILLPLEIGDEPLRGLRVSIAQSAPIVGRVEIENSDAPNQVASRVPSRDPDVKTSPVSKFQILAESEKLGLYGFIPATTNSDGEFRMAGTVPGESYTIRFPSLPSKTYVAEVKQGDRDLTNSPLVVNASADRVRVLLRSDGGRIEGRLPPEESQAFIVLAPKNRRAAHWFKAHSSARDGSFAFADVAPGEYDLFAFDRNRDDEYLNEQYLQKYQQRAVRVVVRPREARSVTISVVRIEGQ